LTQVSISYVLAILFILTSLLMLLIGRMAPMQTLRPTPDRKLVDIQPWKNRFWFYALLVFMMVLLFIFFSKLGIAT